MIGTGSRIRFTFVKQLFVHRWTRLERFLDNADLRFGFLFEPVFKFRHQLVEEITISWCEIETVFLELIEGFPVSSDTKLVCLFLTLKFGDGLVNS